MGLTRLSTFSCCILAVQNKQNIYNTLEVPHLRPRKNEVKYLWTFTMYQSDCNAMGIKFVL